MSKKRKRPREEYYDDSESESTPTYTPRRKPAKVTQLIDPAKVAQLLRASTLPVKEPPKEYVDTNYRTYTMEEASAMVREYLDYKPKDEPSSTS